MQSVLRKVTAEDAPQISDSIMTALLQMLTTSNGKSGGVQEDALLATSTLIEGKQERVFILLSMPRCFSIVITQHYLLFILWRYSIGCNWAWDTCEWLGINMLMRRLCTFMLISLPLFIQYLPLFVVLGSHFLKYMTAFKPYLDNALKNTEEYQVRENHCYTLLVFESELCSLLYRNW